MIEFMEKGESVVLEMEPELTELQNQIVDKNHNYNIVTDTSLKTNEIYKDKEILNKLYKNANKVLFESTT